MFAVRGLAAGDPTLNQLPGTPAALLVAMSDMSSRTDSDMRGLETANRSGIRLILTGVDTDADLDKASQMGFDLVAGSAVERCVTGSQMADLTLTRD